MGPVAGFLALLVPLFLGVSEARGQDWPGQGNNGSLPDLGELPFAIPGAGAAPVVDHHFVDVEALPFDPLVGVATTRLWGESAGSGYRIEVPADWNGDLVIWAWGFTGFCLAPDDPACRLRAPMPWIRRHLVERGYAWATTSLSTSGWAVTQGVIDHVRLRAEFAQAVGPADRVYLVGVSMGGKIAAVSNEQGLPYDGTLSLCGELGHDEFADVLIDWNLLAATLAGREASVGWPPPDDYTTRVVPPIRSALGAPFPAVPTAAGRRLRDAIVRRTGGPRPLTDEAFALADVPIFGSPETLFGMFGGNGDFAVLLHGDASGGVAPWPVDGNEQVVYQLDGDPGLSVEEADLNARVPRIAARETVDRLSFPVADGDLAAPMLVLQALGDWLVPLSLTQRYVERVRAHEEDDLLVTRATRGLTHCGFTRYEVERAFDDLAAWVENDAPPGGDDFLDPAAVASPTFGCAWSGVAPGVPRAADVGVCPVP